MHVVPATQLGRLLGGQPGVAAIVQHLDADRPAEVADRHTLLVEGRRADGQRALLEHPQRGTWTAQLKRGTDDQLVTGSGPGDGVLSPAVPPAGPQQQRARRRGQYAPSSDHAGAGCRCRHESPSRPATCRRLFRGYGSGPEDPASNYPAVGRNTQVNGHEPAPLAPQCGGQERYPAERYSYSRSSSRSPVSRLKSQPPADSRPGRPPTANPPISCPRRQPRK